MDGTSNVIVGLFEDGFPDPPDPPEDPDLLSDLLGLSGSRTSTMICDPEVVLVGEGDETGEVAAELLLLLLGFRKKYSLAPLEKEEFQHISH
jgi:hypothetical protein